MRLMIIMDEYILQLMIIKDEEEEDDDYTKAEWSRNSMKDL
jgi:hypothetical protein